MKKVLAIILSAALLITALAVNVVAGFKYGEPVRRVGRNENRAFRSNLSLEWRIKT